MISEVYNVDCMEYMRTVPDGYFALAVVDPPYGIHINESIGRRAGEKHSGSKKAIWDAAPPPAEYFNELKRVSRNQVIWGANYFVSRMPWDSRCWLMWDKKFSDRLSFSQFELAYTSFGCGTKKFDKSPSSKEYKFHPTQKPVELYEWIYGLFTKPGDRILDTHLGSGSSRIAAYRMGLDFIGCEIDKDYFDMQETRFKEKCLGEVERPAATDDWTLF